MNRKVQNLSGKTRVLGNQSIKHKRIVEFSEVLAAKAVQRFGFIYADEDKAEEAPKPAPKRKPRAKAEPKLEDRV